ncbi:MAG: MFS transporter [Ruminococcaceae bacterium]|nr:MFS transporter [Oscillospiraceae bacterium]
MKLTAKHTLLASYVGYLTQALIVNFAPLLFITFQNTYDLSVSRISTLIAISFTTQFLTDAFAAKFPELLPTRATVVAGQLLAIFGITGYAYLPSIMPPYVGLIICTVTSAIGSGIVEVLVSPIVEACPTDKKSASMSLLHSFYCWGQAGVVLLSTLFFKLVGIENWRILACLWAIVPTVGAIGFCLVPIFPLESDSKESSEKAKKDPSARRMLAVFLIVMIAAGAAEMAMAQWASSFAESALGVSKAVGDLLGPCAFAVLMGLTRVLYAKFSDKLNLKLLIILSAVLCVVCYLVAALSQNPIVSLLGCALCGLAVGITWPGTYSLAAATLPNMEMKTFALLALGGDIGCTLGPALVGWIAGFFGDDLKISFAASTAFPLIIIVLLLIYRKKIRSR